MIACGWCGIPTAGETCSNCRRDPLLPWVQRGVDAPVIDAADTARRRLAEAAHMLGHDASVERVAEFLGVSPRTVRRWREMAG